MNKKIKINYNLLFHKNENLFKTQVNISKSKYRFNTLSTEKTKTNTKLNNKRKKLKSLKIKDKTNGYNNFIINSDKRLNNLISKIEMREKYFKIKNKNDIFKEDKNLNKNNKIEIENNLYVKIKEEFTKTQLNNRINPKIDKKIKKEIKSITYRKFDTNIYKNNYIYEESNKIERKTKSKYNFLKDNLLNENFNNKNFSISKSILYKNFNKIKNIFKFKNK